MLEHLESYRSLPKTVDEIPQQDDVRCLPYIRFVSDALCEDPSDKTELQHVLWSLDAISTNEVCDLYNEFHQKLANLAIKS